MFSVMYIKDFTYQANSRTEGIIHSTNIKHGKVAKRFTSVCKVIIINKLQQFDCVISELTALVFL